MAISRTACCLVLALVPARVHGAPGDVVHQIQVPVSGSENHCSVGVASDGAQLFYDRCGDSRIYRMDPISGELLGSFDTAMPELPNCLAYDSTRDGLWIGGQECNGTGMPIRFWSLAEERFTGGFDIPFSAINPATGFPFVGFCFCDGLAFNANDVADPSDDEIWFSDNLDHNIGVFRPDGQLVAGHDATDVHSSLFHGTSGVAIGGSEVYLGNHHGSQLFRAEAGGGALVGIEAYAIDDPKGEDMSCDPIAFAPLDVLWVRTTPQSDTFPDVVTAYEIESGSCGLGGLTVSTTTTTLGSTTTTTLSSTTTTTLPPTTTTTLPPTTTTTTLPPTTTTTLMTTTTTVTTTTTTVTVTTTLAASCGAAPPNAPCDDGDPCTWEDRCLSGVCRGAPVPMRPACEWAMMAGGPTRQVLARLRAGVEVDGDICAARIYAGQDTLTRGSMVSGKPFGPAAVLIGPRSEVLGDVVTAGGGVFGKPRGTVLPGIEPTLAIPPRTIEPKTATTVYDTTGDDPRVSVCARSRTELHTAAADLSELLVTASLGSVHVDGGDTFLIVPGATTGVVAGDHNVLRFGRLSTGADATVVIDGGGSEATSYMLRIDEVFRLGTGSRILLTGGLDSSRLLLLGLKKCLLGRDAEGAGTLACPYGRLLVEEAVVWNGALAGGTRMLRLRDGAVLTHVPLRLER